MPGTTVTLALEGAVPLGHFADAIAGFRQLIEALSKEVAGDAEIQWTVEELQAGSAIATARGESDAEEVVEHVARAYLEVGRAEETRATTTVFWKGQECCRRNHPCTEREDRRGSI